MFQRFHGEQFCPFAVVFVRVLSQSAVLSALYVKKEKTSITKGKKNEKAMFTESRFQRKIAQNYLRVLFPFCLCVL